MTTSLPPPLHLPAAVSTGLWVTHREDIFLGFISQWKEVKHFVGDYGREEINVARIPPAIHGADLLPR